MQEDTQKKDSKQEKLSPQKKVKPAPKRVGQAALCLSLGLALGILGTNAYTTGRLPWDLLSSEGALSAKDLRKLQYGYQILSDQYIGDVKKAELLNGAMAGMAEAVDDPYTSYLTGDAAESLDETIKGSFEGIGAQVTTENGWLTIISPIKDSPAEKAGLQANDIILEVDGKSTKGLSTEEAVKLIRGEKGTEVELKIKRGDQEQTVKVKRDEIPIETVHAERMDQAPDIGHIQISEFSETTYDELVTSLKNLQQEGAKKFVLDVRGNPGGLLPSVLKVANIFLEDGQTILRVEDNQGEEQVFKANSQDLGDFKVKAPLVVLIDEGSASASEILAGALQQSGQVPVVGQNSYGKGSVQTVFPVDQEGKMKVTVAKWLTPDGTWINEKGIQPDIEQALPDYAKLTLIDTSQHYKAGQQSEAILNIQKILHSLGFLSEDQVTSRYDQDTVEAVKSVQEEAGLEVTGELDGETALRLTQKMQEKIKANDSQLDKAIDVLAQA
ncbi:MULTISPECIES: S41 family peptidase [Aerococcus]|uniref:S41 family peptidase n=2 Tax=Aerococcus TaxID=1375 RepID=A0A5N1GLM7_9LACT|nr:MULTISPECIES: S41 family peptidase [Aerococcus]KAA9301887.1 S41 family peptidase [Aerococcus sanguinicola]MDK6368691.1 S41 family peptidase [Aerococcus sp. UMB9870]MDK6679239.1 S41 family peptidase [Aerococcus sp. UMB8608]MDK6685919.1 S41 family peptidase [Aerococcus sp. UMB8623]MDK6939314.1 S41 family peptidase [Aerococcus sp. UMB8487]